MAECLARALSDLPGPAQNLLLSVRAFAEAHATGQHRSCEDLPFTRRELREWMDRTDYQVRDQLELLVQLEYVEVLGGSVGKRYVYRLSPDHRLIVQAGLSVEEKIVALGLKPADQLKTPTGSDLAGK